MVGFNLASVAGDSEVEVWPDNWPVIELVSLCGTQWRVGNAGPTGLIYESLFALMDRKGLTGDAWWQMFDDVRVVENEALEALRSE